MEKAPEGHAPHGPDGDGKVESKFTEELSWELWSGLWFTCSLHSSGIMDDHLFYVVRVSSDLSAIFCLNLFTSPWFGMLISFTSSHLVLVRCYDAYLAIAHQLWLLSKSELKLRDHLETPNRLLCLTVSSRPECPILSVRWREMSVIWSHNSASCSRLGADRMRVIVGIIIIFNMSPYSH